MQGHVAQLGCFLPRKPAGSECPGGEIGSGLEMGAWTPLHPFVDKAGTGKIEHGHGSVFWWLPRPTHPIPLGSVGADR